MGVIKYDVCDIAVYNEKYKFGLHPHFWCRAPKTLGISSFVSVNQVDFGLDGRTGAGEV